MVASTETDLLIVGAGPTGLYGAYYAGFRGLSVTVLDSLPELGGQITAMYPEKQIFDVGGFPAVKGRDLVESLVQQASGANPTYLLDRTAATVAPELQNGSVTVTLDDGVTIRAQAVIVTAGIGKFTPRPLPAGEGWLGRGMEFFVPSFEPYTDKDVVIVGGGDSAFDWALHLEPIARSVTLVHRRDRFRAHHGTVEAVRGSSVEIITHANVTRLLGEPELESVEITAVGDDQDVRTRKAQAVVAALGFLADLGPLKEWGLELAKRSIVVDTAMRTNLARVYAAGDVTDYPGKLKLISVGFGEVATAVNNAAAEIHPEQSVFPGHSSEA